VTANTGLGWDDVVRVSRDQVSNRLGDEVAILELQKGIYYGLNPTGARVWELLQQPITVRAIYDALLAEYDVDPELLHRDVLALVNDLLAQDLIERASG
jgi:hypothetical protein